MAGHYISIPFITKANPFSVTTKIQYNNNSSEEHVQVQQLKNTAYVTYLGLILCVSWNLMVTALVWRQGVVGTESLLLAIAYLVLGVPSAYASWHRTLNLAFVEDEEDINNTNSSCYMFQKFFVFYIFHVAFCLFGFTRPAGVSIAWFYSASGSGSDGRFIWILYWIAFVLFGCEYALSMRVIHGVLDYRHGRVSHAPGDDMI